jgi:predicted esterase
VLLSKYEQQWKDRRLKYEGYEMPFYYQVFGSRPSDGRSLFISLHGGGGAPAALNDRQYENQQHLYGSTMQNLEGVYLAPRAPTNEWDLWHQAHIDAFLNIIIQMAVLKEQVNPNKVYLLGYSAGGDGVYQLAPRMADRWAAASMMAGHPNETTPEGLRNLPFMIQVGALDSAYDRNSVAQKWGEELDELQAGDPGHYLHETHLYEGMGHWMELKDAVALPWMQAFTRQPLPEKIVWKQDDVHHRRFYWLGLPADLIVNEGMVIARYDRDLNEVEVMENYSQTLHIYLNDDMLDLDRPVTIKFKGEEVFRGRIPRTIETIHETVGAKGDPNLVFSGVYSLRGKDSPGDK